MATSGQVQTNTTYDSYFWVKWEQVGDQDIANNRTQIKWTCGLYSTHKFYTNAVKMSAVSINGTQVFSGGTYSNFTSEGNQTIASGTLWIAHNADGTKSFSISSFTGWLYSNHNYSSNGGSFTLNAIPRQALITAVSDFTDLDNPSITFSNPGGFRMDVWLEPNPIGDHLCVRENIPNTGSYTWSLTAEERGALRNRCPRTQCTIRVGLYSYVGDTQYADYKDKTFTIEESAATKPEVYKMDISLDNNFHPFPEDLGDIYIQGKSKVKVSLSARGKYSASIRRYSAAIDGKTYDSSEFTSEVIRKAGPVDIVGYAVDSRGFTGSRSKQINVVAYSKPSIIPLGYENAILCYRSDSNGNRTGNSTSLWVKAKMLYSDVSQKNTCSFEWRRKLVTEEWDVDHVWLPLNTTTDEYNALIPGVVFDLKQSYTVQIRAIDYIGEQDVKTFEIPTQDVALHLGKYGRNVAVGTYCVSEDYTFHSAWKAIFDKGVVIGDYPVADYIVEAGTSGDWTYVKMASGIAECWAKISYAVELVAENSRATVQLNRKFPITFTFTDLPFCNITLANQTTWNHVLSSTDFTKSELEKFTVYRMGAGVNVTAGGTADVRFIGHWK